MARPLTITAVGDAQVDTSYFKFGTGSLLLDGTGDYLSVPNDVVFSDGTRYFDYDMGPGSTGFGNGWTIEAWMKSPIGGTASGYLVKAGTAWYVKVDITQTTANITLKTNNGTVTGTAQNITADSWVHIVAMSNGLSTNVAHVNGVRVLTSNANNDPNLADSGSTITIGEDWEGWIDSVRISDRIYAEYGSTTFTPPSSDFNNDNPSVLLLLKFNEPDGSTDIEDYVGTFGSAELPTATTALQATATDNPSMVFLGNDVYTWDSTDTWNTIYDGSDRWRAWERANTEFEIRAVSTKAIFASSDLAVNTELSATGLRVKFGQSQLLSEFAVSATAERITQGQSDLNSEFTQTALAERLTQGQSDLATAFGLAARAQVDVDGRSQITAIATITATGRILKLADILVEPFAALTATAEVDVDGKSDLVTAFTQTARGGLLIQVDEPYDYTWDTIDPDTWQGFVLDRWEPNGFFAFDNITLRATAIRLIDGSSALSTAFTQTTQADRLVNAQSDLSVVFTETADADRLVGGSADLASVFDVTATAVNLDIASALMAFDFALQANVGIIIEASAELSDLLSFEISADRLVNAKASLALAFAQDTKPTLIPSVLPMDLPSEFQVTATARRFVGARCDLTALATQLTLAERIRNATAGFIAQFELSAQAGVELNAQIEMQILGFQFSEGRLSDVRGQANLAMEFDTEFAGDLRLLESNIIYKILRDSRQYDIKSETRALPVLPENRTQAVLSETRAYEILPESRSLDIADLMMD